MGTAIVVTSGKGGVGKSTVSLGLASQFAAGGERVLLLDCDSGLRSLDRMTGTEEALVFDSSDVVAGRCAPADAIYPCVTMPGVSLMPAPASGEDLVPERVMLRLVPLLKRYFDRVILDSPAGVGRGFRAAAAAAFESSPPRCRYGIPAACRSLSPPSGEGGEHAPAPPGGTSPRRHRKELRQQEAPRAHRERRNIPRPAERAFRKGALPQAPFRSPRAARSGNPRRAR